MARVGTWFYLVLVVASLLTFAVHEAAHALAGIALGHDMAIGINGVAARAGETLSATDAFIITAAGPLATVAQAAAALLLIRCNRAVWAYAFLFCAWFMRFAAAFVSIFNPNDEARLGLQLGWNMWWLPAATVLLLSLMAWAAARRLRLPWTTQVASYVLCSLVFAAIVFGAARV